MGGGTETVTVNLGPVDLGKIDLLVDQGLFSTRSDFLRHAVRAGLEEQEAIIGRDRTREADS